MNYLDKLERKYGRYAIQNLPMIMVALYAAGYLVQMLMPQLLLYLTLEPYYILHGQIWRIVTWVLIPPSSADLFTIIMLFFYFSIGRTLEQTWGAFRFNLYIFTGILFTVVGAFILYAAMPAFGIGYYFSTYYINMSILLAFALTYPDMQVLLMFVIPLKMKWLAVIYGLEVVLGFVRSGWAGRVVIVASLLNFVVFYFLSGRLSRFTPHQVHRRAEFKKKVRQGQQNGVTKHKCAVCGRTEKDGDHLEFRFCSKCDGNYEYCQDHLFTHRHIKKS